MKSYQTEDKVCRRTRRRLGTPNTLSFFGGVPGEPSFARMRGQGPWMAILFGTGSTSLLRHSKTVTPPAASSGIALSGPRLAARAAFCSEQRVIERPARKPRGLNVWPPASPQLALRASRHGVHCRLLRSPKRELRETAFLVR